MNRIDKDLIKRQETKTIVRINDDVCVDKGDNEFFVKVKVWCGGASAWVTYNRFDLLDEAIAWASIPENVS